MATISSNPTHSPLHPINPLPPAPAASETPITIAYGWVAICLGSLPLLMAMQDGKIYGVIGGGLIVLGTVLIQLGRREERRRGRETAPPDRPVA